MDPCWNRARGLGFSLRAAVPGQFGTPREKLCIMARVTVEDCLEKEDNRFALVVLAAQRCRDLMKGEPALVNSKNKAAVIALREIAKGKVHWNRPSHEAVNEYIQEVEARY